MFLSWISGWLARRILNLSFTSTDCTTESLTCCSTPFLQKTQNKTNSADWKLKNTFTKWFKNWISFLAMTKKSTLRCSNLLQRKFSQPKSLRKNFTKNWSTKRIKKSSQIFCQSLRTYTARRQVTYFEFWYVTWKSVQLIY